MSRPDVSVLLPYRNAAATLDEALESVLDQRGPTLELLAVDDGSSDEGPARLARWARSDPRVVPLSSGGAGLVAALRLAARRARAPWLARMDADDVCLADRLASQCALLEADGSIGAAGTRVEPFPASAVGDGMRHYVAWQNGLLDPGAHERDLFVESPLCHPSVMMRRAAYEAVGGYRDGDFPEDYDLWLRMVDAGWRLAKVPEVLLRWRHAAGRATFADSRYALERFRELKARHLAPRLRARDLALSIWGAGATGRRFARALERHGVRASRFVDIDPRKVGRTARGAPIVAPAALEPGTDLVVVAVGARGARDIVRGRLAAAGFAEGRDYVCAA